MAGIARKSAQLFQLAHILRDNKVLERYMTNHDMNLGNIQNNQVFSVKPCWVSFISPYLERGWRAKIFNWLYG